MASLICSMRNRSRFQNKNEKCFYTKEGFGTAYFKQWNALPFRAKMELPDECCLAAVHHISLDYFTLYVF